LSVDKITENSTIEKFNKEVDLTNTTNRVEKILSEFTFIGYKEEIIRKIIRIKEIKYMLDLLLNSYKITNRIFLFIFIFILLFILTVNNFDSLLSVLNYNSITVINEDLSEYIKNTPSNVGVFGIFLQRFNISKLPKNIESLRLSSNNYLPNINNIYLLNLYYLIFVLPILFTILYLIYKFYFYIIKIIIRIMKS
jgi:hypothetical protein